MSNKIAYSRFGNLILKLFLGLVIGLFALSAGAQNTKGDQPTATPSIGKEKKGKLFGKKQNGGQRVQSSRGQRARNVFPQQGPYIHNPSKKPKKEKASTVRMPSAIQSSPPTGRDKAWTHGTISGTRLKPRSVSAAGRIKNVYPQSGPYVRNASRTSKKERASTVRLPSAMKTVRSRPSGKPSFYKQSGPYVHNASRTSRKERASTVRLPSAMKTVKSRQIGKVNIYKQSGPYVNNPSRSARLPGSDPRNKPLSKSRRLSASQAAAQGRSLGIKGAGFKTITSQFITRGRKNVYWGKFSKKEKAITTDIAGRKLRTKNYHSPKAGLVGRDTLPFFRRSPRVLKRGPAQAGGGYKSATHSGLPWSGDIAGRRLGKVASRKNAEQAGKFIWPRRLSVTAKGERAGVPRRKNVSSDTRHGKASLKPLPFKPPGRGGWAFINFSNSSKGRKKTKGLGGSASGKLWNNRNQPVSVKTAGAGTIKASRFKGKTKGIGGPDFSTIGLSFTGYRKTKRPDKGGGSVSGNIWSNQNKPLEVRRGGDGSLRAGKFQGTAKIRRPEKGGGSVSGKIWSNQNKPLEVRRGGNGTLRAGKFQGTAKVRRPDKGGGSISGQLWNNRNQPVSVKTAGAGTIKASKFKGRIKGIGGTDFSTIGLSFPGYTKTRKPDKGGGSVSGILWNNQNRPLAVKPAGSGTLRAGKFQGNAKTRRPEKGGGSISGQLWNNRNQPIIVKTGGIAAKASADFKGKTKYRGNKYFQNPKAADASLKKDRHPDGFRLNIPILNQTKRSVNAGHYVHALKQNWDYKRNPNSNKSALKVREPGKADAKIGNLQVNVKMRKYTDNNLHPDAKFAHSYRDNVKAERTIFMNVKLVWAKLFKKGENQPHGLKQKPGKPRYDPKEAGLWYD